MPQTQGLSILLPVILDGLPFGMLAISWLLGLLQLQAAASLRFTVVPFAVSLSPCCFYGSHF